MITALQGHLRTDIRWTVRGSEDSPSGKVRCQQVVSKVTTVSSVVTSQRDHTLISKLALWGKGTSTLMVPFITVLKFLPVGDVNNIHPSPKGSVKNWGRIPPNYTLGNQWVYWASLQNIGERFLTGLWVLPHGSKWHLERVCLTGMVLSL